MIHSRASEACRLNVVSALRPACSPAVSFLAWRHAGVLRIRVLATPSRRFLGRPSPIFMLTFPSAASGRLRCESGVTLADILGFALPRGWFLPVSPGTKFVTVGGAIANDV